MLQPIWQDAQMHEMITIAGIVNQQVNAAADALGTEFLARHIVDSMMAADRETINLPASSGLLLRLTIEAYHAN